MVKLELLFELMVKREIVEKFILSNILTMEIECLSHTYMFIELS